MHTPRTPFEMVTVDRVSDAAYFDLVTGPHRGRPEDRRLSNSSRVPWREWVGCGSGTEPPDSDLNWIRKSSGVVAVDVLRAWLEPIQLDGFGDRPSHWCTTVLGRRGGRKDCATAVSDGESIICPPTAHAANVPPSLNGPVVS